MTTLLYGSGLRRGREDTIPVGRVFCDPHAGCHKHHHGNLVLIKTDHVTGTALMADYLESVIRSRVECFSPGNMFA